MGLDLWQELRGLLFGPLYLDRYSTELSDEEQDSESITELSDEEQNSEMSHLQQPPAYSDIFPDGHPDPESYAPSQEMDPLVAAAWQNQTRPIFLLPDHILIRTIDLLDNSGVECVRRVARRFPPLCTEIVLSRPRTYLPEKRLGPFAWSRFESMCYEGQGGDLIRAAEGRNGLPGAGRGYGTSWIETGTVTGAARPRKRLTGGRGSTGSAGTSTARYASPTTLPASSRTRSG
ncbi:hypothetical protein VSDG_07946 [Cytospora chrysosperma]|uniref:F-box domain-containing protein n=1 Tax=Cytospora chrysosperma TaxID=252740 RepID=A0A423VKX1_CYTCH|nr:hypothetical protein VSDG_07946 [Valsa sordida]